MKSKSNQLIISLLCLVMCMLSSCVQPELSMYGNISGIVKDAMSNRPLEGVRVTLTPRGLSQVTESDGQFMFTDLDVGDYTLTFSKVGWEETTQKVTVLAGNSSSVQVTLFENQIGVDVSPEQLNFGSNLSSLQLVMQSDKRTVYYQASVTANWISLSQTTGSITGKEILYVSVSRAGLTAGEHTGSVRISVGDKYITIPVIMIVEASSSPVISLEHIVKVTDSEIVCNGILQSIGDTKGVTDYGICYSKTNSNPTINDAKQTMGSSTEPKSFSCTITGLQEDQLYYLRAYAINEKGVAYSENVLTGKTEKADIPSGEDYSSAKVESGNYKIDLTLISCKRTVNNRVTIESMILNKSISPYTNFRTYYIGDGNTAGVTHVEDDVFTDYVYSNLNQYLNNTSGTYIYGANLPIGASKKFTITIDNVPQEAKTISVYIAGEFRDVSPVEYCYLTFENVPIY